MKRRLLFLLPALLVLLFLGTNSWADPASAAATPPADDSSFGHYLAAHEDVLDPFFQRNQADIAKDAAPVLFSLLGKVIMISLLVSWIIDVFLSRGFSSLFAPAFTKWSRSMIYATGRLVLSILLLIMVSLGFTYSVHEIGIPLTVVLLGVMALPILIIQIAWVRYLFQTNILLSLGFYIVLVLLHSIFGGLITMPVVGASATSVVTGFLDQSITPKLRADADATRRQVVAATSSWDAVQAQVSSLQQRIAQDGDKQKDIEKQIEDKKNSEDYLFIQIMKVRARGDLNAAQSQMNDFLTKFPSGARVAEAKTQLDQINTAITNRDTAKKQADSDAAAAKAKARVDLLADAAAGTATLSELREALIARTPSEVRDLFGPPHETASDRWGYDKRMVLNPITGEKHGLAVQFSDGVVQSVDYYYTNGP